MYFTKFVLFHVLCLLDLWVEDETTYVCEAQNHFGKIQAKAKVTVTGLGTTSEKTVHS